MTSSEVSQYSCEIEDILCQFSEEEVISLATTITGGLLKHRINSRKGAVKAVISYSKDVQSILRRKLFTREKLISYLYEKNIPVKLPITKPEIIGKILKLWNIECRDCVESSISNDDSSIPEVELDDSSVESNVFSNNEHSGGRSDSLQSQSSNISFLETRNNNQQIVESLQNHEVSRQFNDPDVQSTVNILAKEFSQWFYKLLNENQLSLEHFFPDVSLNLMLVSNGEENSKSVSNDPAAITNCLLATKLQYDLFFNPNISKEGLKAEMDPHGLVMVVICGTLHSKSVCVGVFEQMFALARDPYAENNWKIKRTDLRLKSSSNVSAPATLCDTNVSSSDNHIAIND